MTKRKGEETQMKIFCAVASSALLLFPAAAMATDLAPLDVPAKALSDDFHLRAGLNVHDGKLTCEPVAGAHGLAYTQAQSLLAA